VKRLYCGCWALLGLAGCFPVTSSPHGDELSSFQVDVTDAYLVRPEGQPRVPIPVVLRCERQYGGQARVPKEARGTPDCPYAMPLTDIAFDVSVSAIGTSGALLTSASPLVTFRVVPGALTGDYSYRSVQLSAGRGAATVKARSVFGKVRLWAEDAPLNPLYSDGGVADAGAQPSFDLTGRTFAVGVSPILYFEEPTLARLQIPSTFDNRSSPLVGQFVTVGHSPEDGEPFRQSCADDPEHDGQLATMVVTGLTTTGFYVTDLTACRLREDLYDPVTGEQVVRVPEPSGFMPGTYGSIFVFNAAFPEGLDPGDLIWSVAGTVAEPSASTQLTFPSWSIREKVRLLPESEWNKYLDQVVPATLNLRMCGLDDNATPFLTDTLCGHLRTNLKMESLESSLVQIRNVRFPRVFANCDLNGDGHVPLFCESHQSGHWAWDTCTPGNPTDPDANERQCNIDCTVGQGPYRTQLCSEETNYLNTGQFVVALPGPGSAEANLDDSVPSRIQSVAISDQSTQARHSYRPGAFVRIWCNTRVRFAFGPGNVQATEESPILEPRTLLPHIFSDPNLFVAFVAESDFDPDSACVIGQDVVTRVNLNLRNAIPDFPADCTEDDQDPDSAEECHQIHAARYEVLGHLRHGQASRPRWTVVPRYSDDICCRPGPDLPCPSLIQQCSD
jgi:hypothetical protein